MKKIVYLLFAFGAILIIAGILFSAVSYPVGAQDNGYPAPGDGYPAPIDEGYPAPGDGYPVPSDPWSVTCYYDSESGYPVFYECPDGVIFHPEEEIEIKREPSGIYTAFDNTITSFMSIFKEAQETCPDGGEWIKVDGLSGMSYELGAPEGMLIIEWCYKASTEVVYGNVNPPASSVVVTSTVGHELSHASMRLINIPTFTSTPFSPPTATPSETVETPTSTVEVTPTYTPEVTNTPSLSKTPDPTSTPTAVNTLPPPKKETPSELLPLTGGDKVRHQNSWVYGGLGLIGIALVLKSFKKQK